MAGWVLIRALRAAACLLASSCASSGATPPAGAASVQPSAALPTPLRVVPQLDVTNRRFAISAGGRFVVFPTGAVDLVQAKVAWARSFSLWPADAPEDRVAIESPNGRALVLFDLRDGSGLEFSGQRVAHAALAPHWVALQRAHTLAIVDSLAAREVLSVPVPSAVASVILASGQLHVLVDKEATRSQPLRHFDVLSFDATSGEARGVREVALDYRVLVPEPASGYRSAPYLTQVDPVGLCLTVVGGCPACPDAERTPLRVYRLPIDGGSQATWRTEVVAPLDAVGSKLVRADYLPTEFPPLPAAARATLDQLPKADPALLGRVSPSQSEFVTSNATRACLWSVAEASRVGCVSPPAEQAFSTRPATCQGAVDPPDAAAALPLGAVALTRAGRLEALAYDLADDSWALMLRDGRFTGSPEARRYLAFYRPDGTLLDEHAVAALQLSRTELARDLAQRLACAASE